MSQDVEKWDMSALWKSRRETEATGRLGLIYVDVEILSKLCGVKMTDKPKVLLPNELPKNTDKPACPHTWNNGETAWGCVLPYGHKGDHQEYAQSPVEPFPHGKVTGCALCGCVKGDKSCTFDCTCHDVPA